MRKIATLLFASIFLWFYSSYGQSLAADSIKKLLEANPKEDTTRVNLLNGFSAEIRRTDRNQADSLADQALALAQQLKYPKGEGNALVNKGVVYYLKIDYKNALSTFEKARQIFEKIGDNSGMANMLYRRGRVYLDDGKYAQALDDYLHGIKLAEEAGNIRLAIDIKGTTGYLYNILGEYAKAIPYYTDALNQAKQLGYKPGMSGSYNSMGKTYKTQGNYPEALQAYQQGLAIDKELKSPESVAIAYGNIGDVYERMGKYPDAFSNVKKYLAFYQGKEKMEDRTAWGEWVLGKAFTHSGNADSGYFYARHSYQLSQKVGWRLYLREITLLIAESAARLKQWDTAYKYQGLSSNYKDTLTGKEIAQKTAMLQSSFELDKKQAEIAFLTKDKQLQVAENRRERLFMYALLGGLGLVLALAIILMRNNRQKHKANILLQKQKKMIDEKAMELSIQKDNLQQSYSNVELLGEIGRKITSSLTVEKIISTVYDNVNSLMDASVFGIGIYNDEQKRIEFPATYENGQALPFYTNSVFDENRFAALCYITGNEIVMGDLATEYKTYLQQLPTQITGQRPVSLIYLPLKIKEKMLGVITTQSFQKNAYTDYHLFMLRNIAIYTAIALENADSFRKLNQTVVNLKNTQTQLIQSEKMASLGELTAGIAHEIQNPLNFVNNFSEVNSELVEEMKQELEAGKEKEAIHLADDIKQNSEKINFHGKRADAIVKSMLQHSRNSSGQKEPTDINALADECLRLSYHGMRAKDKTFNVKTQEDFDKNIPNLNIASQDIGRVILNLFTNAFYAVMQKQKQLNGSYEPVVSVKTAKTENGVMIAVRDNGMGVPQKVLDKIFQPFFTTKPVGEGTGLGLSMSYDIITKGHGGELKVDTKEGEYAEFIIRLPDPS